MPMPNTLPNALQRKNSPAPHGNRSKIPSTSPIEVVIKNGQRRHPLPQQIEHWARTILMRQRCGYAEVGLVFVNDRRMRDYNRQYRGQDKTTNVLAFATEEGGGIPHHGGLGDIVISAETAAREAHQAGKPYPAYLLTLLIHGLLHLFGYDHERSPKDARRMQQRERRLFHALWNSEQPSMPGQ